MNYDCTHQGHAIPQGDSEEHQAWEWCPCAPELVKTKMGEFWRHNSFNFDDLIDSAEHIRMITSTQLYRDYLLDKKSKKAKAKTEALTNFVPFPLLNLTWPPHVNRCPGQELA